MIVNEKLRRGVSRGFISLINEEKELKKKAPKKLSKIKKKKSENISSENSPMVTKMTKSATKIFSISTPQIPQLVKNNYSTSSIPKEENGEENYEESPCAKAKIPNSRLLRRSDEKFSKTSHFSIVPRLITGTMEFSTINLEDESSEEEIFERGEENEDEREYELFTWCEEFDDIVNESHQEINLNAPKIQDIKNICIKDCPHIDNFTKYHVLKEFMQK